MRGGENFGYDLAFSGDFLLIYKLERSKPEIVVFVRAGTHAELFE
jgi:mRNA-degrading endonuclease YafQ of YafQ-DinJ toxin-antitoxin module